MGKSVLAIGCHPDDIEFVMAGTLILLGRAGYELHYMNVANGCMGSVTEDHDAAVAAREAEAKEACASIGATWHAPVVDDIAVIFSPELLARVGAVVREVSPSILLTQSPEDYMEDHQNTSRLAHTAAFCRGMRNFETVPERKPVTSDVAVYHAQPHGNRDPLRRLVRAGLYVDISDVMPSKTEMLACHKSQKEWLDASQGMDSYLRTMEELAADTGRMSGAFTYAEGWRRRSHLGFCGPNDDPLYDALGDHAVIDGEYEASLG